MKKIIFVCLGNICRSPMAEFVMKDMLREQGLQGEVEIISRATSGWEHGNPMHRGTQTELKRQGVPFDREKTSLQITTQDFYDADMLIAMDESNYEDLMAIAPGETKEKVSMLLPAGIPDPWYSGDFAGTYDLVREGCELLVERLQS